MIDGFYDDGLTFLMSLLRLFKTLLFGSWMVVWLWGVYVNYLVTLIIWLLWQFDVFCGLWMVNEDGLWLILRWRLDDSSVRGFVAMLDGFVVFDNDMCVMLRWCFWWFRKLIFRSALNVGWFDTLLILTCFDRYIKIAFIFKPSKRIILYVFMLFTYRDRYLL